MKTSKDKLIEMQQNGHPISIGFISIGKQVFKVDKFLERALWEMELKLEECNGVWYLIDVYNPFNAHELSEYELDNETYLDIDVRLE